MKKIISTIILLLSISPIYAQKDINFLLGKWEIFKTASINPHIPLTKSDSMECIGAVIVFKANSIVVPKGFFYGECPSSITYSFKRVDAKQYFEGDDFYLESTGYKGKMMDIVETSCGVPFANIQIHNYGLISMAADGYIYFLKRIEPVRQ